MRIWWQISKLWENGQCKIYEFGFFSSKGENSSEPHHLKLHRQLYRTWGRMLQQLLHFCLTGFASNHILKPFKCSDAQWNISTFILQQGINKTDKNVPDKSGFCWYTDIQEILLFSENLTPFKLDWANCVCQKYWYEIAKFPPPTLVFGGQKECEQRRK